MPDYSDQTALVTGAAKGIGRAVAITLAASGRFVYLNYSTSRAAALETLSFIRSQGGNGDIIEGDVSSMASADQAVQEVIQARGRIDILVNNAGIHADGLLVRMKPDAWQRVIETNLTGFYNVTRPCVKQMLRQKFGRIVTITSASGQAGQAGQVNYSASKAGLIGATKALAKEVASRNITVNAVAPGFIETDMTKGMDPDSMVSLIPCGRLGTPEDVAVAVDFFCSRSAGYITGQVLGVNGGML